MNPTEEEVTRAYASCIDFNELIVSVLLLRRNVKADTNKKIILLDGADMRLSSALDYVFLECKGGSFEAVQILADALKDYAARLVERGLV